MQTHAQTKDALDVLAALGPVIVGLIAVGVAWWQGWLQKRQAELLLFKERYAVYNAVQAFLRLAIDREDNKFTAQDIRRFELAVRPTTFLFGPDAVAVVNKIRIGVSSAAVVGDGYRYNFIDAKYPEVQLVEWAADVLNVLGPYLQVHRPSFKLRVEQWVDQVDANRRKLHNLPE